MSDSHSTSGSVKDEAEFLLGLLDLSKFKIDVKSRIDSRRHGIEVYREAFPIKTIGDLQSEDFKIFIDAGPTDVGRVRQSIIFPAIEGETAYAQLLAFVTRPVAALRGRCSPISRFVGELYVAFLDHDLTISSTSFLVNWHPKAKRWIGLEASKRPAFYDLGEAWRGKLSMHRDDDADWINTACSVLHGWQFSLNYFWRIVISSKSGLSISIATDPQGAIELLRLRDVPPGKTRRDAILHWVRAHSRKKRDGGVADIRRHMRGRTEFDWGDLTFSINPSADDLRILEQERSG